MVAGIRGKPFTEFSLSLYRPSFLPECCSLQHQMLFEDRERLCPLIGCHQLLSAKCQSFVAGLLQRSVERRIQIGIHITDNFQIDDSKCGHEHAFQ